MMSPLHGVAGTVAKAKRPGREPAPRFSCLLRTVKIVRLHAPVSGHLLRPRIALLEVRMSKNVRDLFTTELSAPMLAVPEVYGSKLVAAMDRQHPRDLFDMRACLGVTGYGSREPSKFIVVCWRLYRFLPPIQQSFSVTKRDTFRPFSCFSATSAEFHAKAERFVSHCSTYFCGSRRGHGIFLATGFESR